MNDLAKNILLWVIVAIILMSVFNNLSTTNQDSRMSYSEFMQNVQQNQVQDVVISGRNINGTLQTGPRLQRTIYIPSGDHHVLHLVLLHVLHELGIGHTAVLIGRTQVVEDRHQNDGNNHPK